MTITVLFFIGRLFLGYYWLEVAYKHIFHSGHLIGYTQSTGLKPGTAKLAVIGSGVLALVGGLSILLGVWPYLGIACIVVFLLGVTFQMHPHWKAVDPAQKMNQRIQFHKNMAIAAATLCMAAIAQPWMWSLHW